MCGICGIINFDNNIIDNQELLSFTNSLNHRGPDSNSIFINKNSQIGLGHTRLSIIDISSKGKQPMTSIDGRFSITFNGEIYNYLELKNELVSLGYSFKSNTDTEVLLNSFIEWGEDCQKKFNGMWAFAIWDELEKNLFISRDRYGVKSIYYYEYKNCFYFASELKSFMKLNKNNIPDFNYNELMHLGKGDLSEDTILQNVKLLNPGYQIDINIVKKIKLKKWWSTLDNLSSAPKNYFDQIDQFKFIFIDSCKLRLRSDVNIATSLSGGLDSSSVVSVLNYLLDNKKKVINDGLFQSVFIADYLSQKNSEINYAKSVLQNKNLNSFFISVKKQDINIENLMDSTFAQEIIGDDALGPWMIYKNMKNLKIKVSIDGHGPDELMGGYTPYLNNAISDNSGFSNILRFIQLKNLNIKMNYNNYFEYFARKFFSPQSKEINKNKNYNFFNEDLKTRRTLSKENTDHLNNFDRELFNDFHYTSLPKILLKFDKISMAHGIESREPFLDYRLVSFIFSLPSTSKMGNNYTKRILRDSMSKFLPKKIKNRVIKRGFDVSEQWFNKNYKDIINERLSSSDFKKINFIDHDKIALIYDENKENINYKKLFRYLQIYIIIEKFNKFKNA